MKRRLVAFISAVIMVAGMALTALPAVSAGSTDTVVYKEWKLADELREIARASSEAGVYTEPGEFSLVMRHQWYNPGVQNFVYGGNTGSSLLYGYYGSGQGWRNYIEIPINQGTGAGKNVQGAVSHGDYTGTDHEFTITTPVSGKYNFVPMPIGGAGAKSNSASTLNGSGWVATLSVGGTVIETKTINGDGELPSFTGMDIDYGTPITLMITPVANDFTSNQANIMYLNFSVQMTDEYLKRIPNPAVEVAEYDVATDLVVTNQATFDKADGFAIPASVHGLSVWDDHGANLSGAGISAYYEKSPAGVAGGITRYRNTYDPSSAYYLTVDPSNKSLTFGTKHYSANHAIKFTAPFTGEWTFGIDSVSGNYMYFIDKDGNKIHLTGKFEKTYKLYENDTVWLMQEDGDAPSSWTGRSNTVFGYTISGRGNIIIHEAEYRTDSEISAYDELKKVSSASDWPTTYQAGFAVKHSGSLHLYRNVGNGQTPDETMGSKVDSNTWLFGSSTENGNSPYGRLNISKDGKASANGYELRFAGKYDNSVGFYYDVPTAGTYFVSSDSVSVYGAARTFIGYVDKNGVIAGTEKSISGTSFEASIDLTAGQRLVFTVLLGNDSYYATVNNMKVGKKVLVKEAYEEVLPILIDDTNAPQHYQYKVDKNNYAETILGKAAVSYQGGVLSYSIPARDDNGVIVREYPYDRMDFGTDYHWNLWLNENGKWVKMSKEAGSDTFTAAYTAANGLYRVHVTCTDDNGVPLLDKVNSLFDYTAAELGNAVITDVLVNGEAVDKSSFVDVSADRTLTVTVKGVNIAGVSAKKNDSLVCVFTKQGNDYVYTFENVESGEMKLDITAKASAEKKTDVRKITVYTYNTREIGNYTEIAGADVGVSSDGMITISAGETVNGGTFDYKMATLYTGKTVYSVSGLTANSLSTSIGKQYGQYTATVYANGKSSSDYATVIFDYPRPKGSWNMVFTLNGENTDDITVPAGTPIEINMDAAFSGSLASGEHVEYSIIKYDMDGSKTLRKWSENNTYTYVPENTGYYQLLLMAKGSKTDALEVVKKIRIVAEGSMYEGDMDVEYSNASVGVPVVIKAITDSDTLLYRFKISNGYSTKTLQYYSPSNSCVWIPSKEGTYELVVEALDRDSFGIFDIHKSISVEVSAVPEGSGVAVESGFTATVSENISDETEFNALLMGGGGYVTGLVMHPTDNSIMYARTDVGGAYRWDGDYDNGKGRWIAITECFGENETTQYAVDGIAIDPNNLDVVYMCCGNGNGTGVRGIYKSTNRGEAWALVKQASFFGNSRDRELGECIMVDPNDSNTVYCGTRGEGLLISRDAGKTWSKVSTSIIPSNYSYPSAPYGIRGVEIDSRSTTASGRSANVYVSLPNVGIYKSSDGGETWAKINGIPATIQNMKLDTAGNIYITATDGVYRYDGTTVVDISPPYNHTVQTDFNKAKTYKAIAVSDVPGTLAVCRNISGYRSGGEVIDSQMNENIYYSTDYGATWTLKSENITKADNVPWWPGYYFSSNTACMMFHKDASKNTTELWFSDWYGVWMTKDITQTKVTWYNKTRGIEEACVTDMMSNKSGPVEFNMTMVDNGGMAIANVGDYATARYNYNGRALDFCESKPQYVAIAGIDNSWQAGSSGISTDYGVNFTSIWGDGAPTTVLDIAIDCKNENNLVIYPTNDVPYYTTDMGATWHKATGFDITGTISNSVEQLVSDRVKSGVFYYSYGTGFYRSEDGGKTWAKTCELPCAGEVKASPGKGGYVIVSCGSQGLYYSKNYGKDFTKVKGITSASSASFGIGENGNGFVVYVRGTIDGKSGLFMSDDGLNTFVQYNDIETNKLGLFTGITADRRVYGRVFLGSGGRGIMVASLKEDN